MSKNKKRLFIIFEIPLTTKGDFDKRSFKKIFNEPTLSTERNTLTKYIVSNAENILQMDTTKLNEILQRLLCEFYGWSINYLGHSHPDSKNYYEGYWDKVLNYLLPTYQVMTEDEFNQMIKRRILEPLSTENTGEKTNED